MVALAKNTWRFHLLIYQGHRFPPKGHLCSHHFPPLLLPELDPKLNQGHRFPPTRTPYIPRCFNFVLTWRQAFLNAVQPRHLPAGWNLHRSIRKHAPCSKVEVIGVLLDWFAEKIEGIHWFRWGLFNIYQGNPSIFPKGHLWYFPRIGSPFFWGGGSPLSSTNQANIYIYIYVYTYIYIYSCWGPSSSQVLEVLFLARSARLLALGVNLLAVWLSC